jgi:hypothetical protein
MTVHYTFAARLQDVLAAEGISTVGVSIGSDTDTSTWTVQPQSAQSSSQPFINAVDTNAWTLDMHYDRMRQMRNDRLTVCDWTQANDTQLSEESVDDWQVYRQALRDLPATTSDPTNPDWPSAPV